MNIVIGSGKRRTVIELPTGEVFAKAAKDEPAEYEAVRHNICEILHVAH